LKLVGIQNYLSAETEIHFTSSDFVFKYLNRDVEINDNYAVIDESNTSSLFRYLGYDFTYIPSERSLAITLADSLFALMQTGTALPNLFLRFGNKFQKARKVKESFDYQKVIGVSYIHKESGDLVKLQNGKEISIDDSSSGIQGAVSLLTVFDYVTESSATNNFLVIEEPELNCFPNTQYKLMNHFVENKFNNSPNTNQFLLTTHSPYILTSLNNLMYAYQVGQKHKKEVNNIVEEKYWVNPAEVSAYQLLSDGTCISILDKEVGMIESERIDEVSRTLNNDFDKLQDIELGVVHE
jgi:predicted ATPase